MKQDIVSAIERVLKRCGPTNHSGTTVMRYLLEELTNGATDHPLQVEGCECSSCKPAAAEVGEPLQDEPAPEVARQLRKAAAEVGESLMDEQIAVLPPTYGKEIEAATIERCAQVADRIATEGIWDGETMKLLREIAAAIRKLKDES